MKELNLHEEIIKSLKLMSYDRSLTLIEQTMGGSAAIPGTPTSYYTPAPSEKEKRESELKKREEEVYNEAIKASKKECDRMLKTTPQFPYQKTAKEVFLELRDEVGIQKDSELSKPSTWLEPSAWGTSDSDLISSLKKIKDKQTYIEVRKYIHACYPKHGPLGMESTIIGFLQDEEYSKGQFLSKNYDERTPMLAYQYEFNDKTLEQFENILRKFNPKEIYSKEYSLVSSDFGQQIKGAVLPPLVRETLHLVLPILSAFAAISTAGAATFLGRWLLYGIIEVGDALVYISDNNSFMAGLSLFFAMLPAGKLFKLVPSIRNLGKKGIFAFLDKLAGKTTEPLTQIEKNILKELSTSAVRGEIAMQLIRASFATILKRSLGGRITYHFIKGILFLVRNGYLGVEFLVNMGLFYAGGMWTWSKIASYIGLSEEVNEVLKDETIKPAEENLYDYSDVMYGLFKTYYDNNLVISTSMGIKFNPTVFLLQKFLEKSDSNYKSYDFGVTNSVDKDVVTYNMGGIKQKEGNKIFIFINERPNKGSLIDKVGQEIEIKNTSFNGKYKIKGLSYDKNNKVQGVYIESNFKPKKGDDVDLTFKNKGTINIKSAVKGILQGDTTFKKELQKAASKLTFKYGYFGNNTFESVKTYQQKNNIKPTGVVDQTTLKIIMTDLKSKKYGKISISLAEFKKYIQNPEEQELKNKNNKEIETKIDTLIINNSQQITDSVINRLNSVVGNYTKEDSIQFYNYSLDTTTTSDDY